MQESIWNQIIEQQVERSLGMLGLKNNVYSNGGHDRLHAFRKAAALRETTLREALSGMLVKHTISLFDALESDDTFSKEFWDEKISDHINYLLILQCILHEERQGTQLAIEFPEPS